MKTNHRWWNISYRQAGREFVLSEDFTPTDDAIEHDSIDEMDKGFVDNSVEAPSISDLLTVGAGASDNDEENEVCYLTGYWYSSPSPAQSCVYLSSQHQPWQRDGILIQLTFILVCIICIYVGCPPGSGSDITYVVVCTVCFVCWCKEESQT